jgi:hypothetical protein
MGRLNNPNVFSEVCSSLIGRPEDEHDIITFCENRVWGLGYTLRPIQKFILKLFYGVPLDNLTKTIDVMDMFRERLIHRLSEVEYFQFLQDEHRVNLTHPPDRPMQEMVLVIGRRGTKSTSASMISAYETYRLLRKAHPQEYYGILDADDIRITNVANSLDQATKLFKLIQGNIEKCEYFHRYVAGNTAQFINLWTSEDKRGQESSPSIRVTCGSCNARTLRGGANIVVIMDEEAHFLNNLGNRSDTEMYDALTPSTGDFGLDGKILNLSSPLSKNGKFYELYVQGMQGDQDLLVLQIPSWEANQALVPSFLRVRYKRDPARFMVEYGAQFSEAANAYVDDFDKFRDVVIETPYVLKGSSKKRYFFGVDLGLGRDATGISVGHVEWESSQIVEGSPEEKEKLLGISSGLVPIICHDTTVGMQAGVGEFEDLSELLLAEVVDRIFGLTRNFPIEAGVIDQWCGPPLMQGLKAKGLRQFELVYFNQRTNSEIYTVLKTLWLAKQIRILGGWQSPLVQEMLTLEKRILPDYLIKVEAPHLQGYHDDLSDSLARMTWVAYKKGVAEGERVTLGSVHRGGQTKQKNSLFGRSRKRSTYLRRFVR